MDKNKERQEISLIGRILSMEALLLMMGVASLVYGIIHNVGVNIFFGIFIILGVFFLVKVRKKDWKKHWEDLEAEQKREAERRSQPPPTDEQDGKK